MKKLLFTGGTGFLGKNVMPLLVQQYEVTTCGITPDDMLKAKPTKTEAITNVNNRVGPGSGYKKIGLIKDGTAVTMTTILDGWGYIPAKGGWSMTKYFKL